MALLDILNKPGMGALLSQIGMGLLAGSQAQRYGQNPWAAAGPAITGAIQNFGQRSQQQAALKAQQLQNQRLQQQIFQTDQARAKDEALSRGLLGTPAAMGGGGAIAPTPGLLSQPPGPERREALMGALAGVDPQAAMGLLLQQPDAPDAPNVFSYYDPQGREHKGYLDPATRQVVPIGGPKAATPTAQPTSEFERHLATLPPEQRDALRLKRLEKMAAQSGMQLRVGPDGEITLTQGPGDLMQGATRAKIEERLLNSNQQIVEVTKVIDAYRPEFQELDTRWDAFLTRWGEKLKGVPFVEQLAEMAGTPDRQLLEDFTTHKQSTSTALNNYIRAQTGAQMSVQEAKRLMQDMPVAGTGLFDGDSPTEFHTKARNVQRKLLLYSARYNYALKNGLSPLTDLTIEQVSRIMSEREDELSAQGLPDEEIRRALSIEFFGGML